MEYNHEKAIADGVNQVVGDALNLFRTLYPGLNMMAGPPAQWPPRRSMPIRITRLFLLTMKPHRPTVFSGRRFWIARTSFLLVGSQNCYADSNWPSSDISGVRSPRR
jgi:hypothetical protein